MQIRSPFICYWKSVCELCSFGVALMKWLLRKRHTLTSVLILALLALVQFSSPASAQATDPPCIHGMRIVGEQNIYLSHMGLFNSSCHDYQGIFEVAFEGPNNPQNQYLNAQKSNPNQNEFTLEPTEKFILPDLASGKIASFKARIHPGQYERTGQYERKTEDIREREVLDGNVIVKVKRVLYFRQFNPGAKQPAFSEYLLFGSGTNEQLAAHLITAPPDFDQVVALKTTLPFTDTELAKAIRLVLPNRPTPNANANLSQAIKLGEKPAVRVNGKEQNQFIEGGQQYFLETTDYQ